MVIAALATPNHSTIAEFRRRHRAGVGGVVHRGVQAVPQGRAGEGRCACGRRDEAAWERLAARQSRL